MMFILVSVAVGVMTGGACALTWALWDNFLFRHFKSPPHLAPMLGLISLPAVVWVGQNIITGVMKLMPIIKVSYNDPIAGISTLATYILFLACYIIGKHRKPPKKRKQRSEKKAVWAPMWMRRAEEAKSVFSAIGASSPG